jgi:hypothetical protein
MDFYTFASIIAVVLGVTIISVAGIYAYVAWKLAKRFSD